MSGQPSADPAEIPNLRDRIDYAAWHEMPVRFNDVDMQGHVNNCVFPIFFEAGRLSINRGPDSPPLEPGIGPVVARIELDYLHPLQWPATVSIGTRVLSIGRSSARFGQGLFKANACLATCVTRIVFVELASGRPMQISDARRAFLYGCR